MRRVKLVALMSDDGRRAVFAGFRCGSGRTGIGILTILIIIDNGAELNKISLQTR